MKRLINLTLCSLVSMMLLSSGNPAADPYTATRYNTPATSAVLNTDNAKSDKSRKKAENPGKDKNSAVSIAADALNYAKAQLGVQYMWGGRTPKQKSGNKPKDGYARLDCMGLVFASYAYAKNESWRKYDTYPSRLVKSGELGKPVKGLDGILKKELDADKLKKLKLGDILYFLEPGYESRDKHLMAANIKDPATGRLISFEYKTWHMGMYAGNGQVINAFPGDKVRYDMLTGNGLMADEGAFFVTRITQTRAAK